jgi:transglutaminase-like putative cysteine protease
MVAMLRSQGVAAKLVVGYAGTAYHAWINVYTKETGWIEAVIYFDGTDWKLMDPTFASTGKSSRSVMEFINDPANYTAKYVY